MGGFGGILVWLPKQELGLKEELTNLNDSGVLREMVKGFGSIVVAMYGSIGFSIVICLTKPPPARFQVQGFGKVSTLIVKHYKKCINSWVPFSAKNPYFTTLI